MLSIKNLSFYFGSRILYDDVSLHIKPKDKIGLIGANGTGKSTLLRMITGEYTPDEGDISKSNDCSIEFLNQDLLSYQTEDSILLVAMGAFEEAMKLQGQIDKVLKEMEEDYQEEQVTRLTKLQERFEALDGYSIQAKAEEILEGLGFKTADLSRPLKTFSGGWRMRVMLAKLLLCKPNLLMLDEPTNHLDLPSIQWIEEYLQRYEGAVIVVSHDREFMDNTVKSIVEVSSAKLNVYAGNYSYYVKEKQLRAEIQKNSFENQQAKIRQTERFIARFKATASKAKQVQSRVKSLDKMEVLDDVIDETAKVKFRFNFKSQPGKNIFSLKDVSKSYGDLKILEKTTAIVERGDKIALIGANGKGKSTLLRIIAGTEKVDNGERSLGHNVKFSFFAQHQLESLNVENNLIDELKESGSDKSEVELRTILGCFLFSNDDVFKKIKVLSGGEKSRVALAKTLISESNFLLLDEPTNHLDIQSVNILTQALQQYEGTYVVISHDRHFISQVANKIWYIEDHEIKEFPGTYDEYKVWTAEKASAQKKNEIKKVEPKKIIEVKALPVVDESKNSQKELKALNTKLERVEKKIGELETQKLQLENELSKPSIYGNVTLFAETNSKYEKVKQEIDQEQKSWESIVIELETVEKKLV
jgi:ATP-binding cassette subfamily F protein 3